MFDFGPPPWLFEGVILTIVTAYVFSERLGRLVRQLYRKCLRSLSNARGSEIQKET